VIAKKRLNCANVLRPTVCRNAIKALLRSPQFMVALIKQRIMVALQLVIRATITQLKTALVVRNKTV
jgi:hypothetical protein